MARKSKSKLKGFTPILSTVITTQNYGDPPVELGQLGTIKSDEIELPELIQKVRAIQVAFVERSLSLHKKVEELEHEVAELKKVLVHVE